MGGACSMDGEMRNSCKILTEKSRGDQRIDGWIILKWLLKE
jgi:hypothetical protein